MRKPIKNIDYITKDYEGFRQLMLDKAKELAPEWTDKSSSDFGVVMVELLAYGLDILSFYQDKNLQESFLHTARTRKAIIDACKTYGYELSLQTPFVHPVTFTKSSEYLDDIVIVPANTKVSTDPQIGEPVVFETNEELVIGKGVQEGTVLVTQGITVEQDNLGMGNNEPNQQFILGYPDVLLDTLVVTVVENGIPRIWDRVDNFLNSQSDDRHYTVEADENNNFKITFGSGNVGMLVPRNALVVARYRVGGGLIGDVGLNTIVETPDTEIAGIQTITNKSGAYKKGADVESIEHARVNAPRYYRSVGRAVTAKDFEDISSRVSGVCKVKCIETFNLNRDLYIYVVPTDYKAPSEGLKKEVKEVLSKCKIVHDNPIIKDPKYIDYSIDATVVTYSNYLNKDIKAKVEEAIEDAFDLAFMEFGEEVTLASIVKVVMSVEGVRNVSITKPAKDVEVKEDEIARLKTLTIKVEGGVDSD